MSTYKQILYQIIFGTKDRKPTIPEPYSPELYAYIWGIIKKNKCKLYRINGVEDHIHILSDLHPTVALADYIKDIKIASNLWMKENGNFPDFTDWQAGYGAFTYSIDAKAGLIKYIMSQKEHHKKETFFDEFKRILIEHEIVFDEKYLL